MQSAKPTLKLVYIMTPIPEILDWPLELTACLKDKTSSKPTPADGYFRGGYQTDPTLLRIHYFNVYTFPYFALKMHRFPYYTMLL